MLLLPVFLLAALAVFANRKKRADGMPDMHAELMRAAWFIALLVVANAAICGILSGANGRYQTRLLWVLALAMMALAPAVLPQLKRLDAAALLRLRKA